jgi:hypothetical protein
VICLPIFADADGETHMEDVEITFQPRSFSKTILHYAFLITPDVVV